MERRTFILGTAALLVPLTAACQQNEGAAHTEPAPKEGAAGEKPHWNYDDPQGWESISDEYRLCGEGKAQSPIDITGAHSQDLPNVQFAYRPSALQIVNNGHTVQADYDSGSSITFDGVTYDVAQMHYHAPSEHELDGKASPVELHIVHKAGDKVAVVALMVEEGAENAALAPFVDNAPAEHSEQAKAVQGVTWNVAGLLPSDQRTFRYQGSLTTPSCTEGVAWNVLITPIRASAGQIQKLTTLYNHNARPVQPLNGRTIELDSTP